MTIERTACLCFCIAIAPAVAAGQQRSGTADTAPGPATTVIERTYPFGDFAPWRQVQTRSVSGNREVVVETIEAPDIEGRLRPTQDIVTETNRTAPNTAHTRRDVFGFAESRRRQLLETTESQRETLANGDTSTVHSTWAPDLNGRSGPRLRQVEKTRSPAPDVRETHTTFLAPGPEATLRETERIEYTERRIDPGVVRYNSTHLVRDVNGRWQPIEIRRGEIREIGASERIEEETIERPDMNGKLAVEERNVIRRSMVSGQEHVLIETYAPYANGLSRPGSSLTLIERVRVTTTVASDGGRRTVEEVEGASAVALNDPMRLISRTLTTVHQAGTNRSITERQVYERDLNGRLQVVVKEREETVRR